MPRKKPSSPTSWDPVANWYKTWVGADGSDYHHRLAIPTVLRLLNPQANETILDVGCGTGVLAHHLNPSIRYIGVDASPRLLTAARRAHGRSKNRTFLQGDARSLSRLPGLTPGVADGVVFMLSIQDMEPLSEVLRSAAWATKPGGRLVILMMHPCFRIPRQSGWGWDEERKLQYRRIDSYLSPMTVPVRPIARGKPGSIKAFHVPLSDYVNELVAAGFSIRHITEIPAYPGITRKGPRARAENRANQEIPLFLGLLAERWRPSNDESGG